eukprot:253200-Pleurochrysis_carterae.AAC.1
MNDGGARGGAKGFGLETLPQLLSIKSTGKETATTLMHYLAETLGKEGVSAVAIKAELRRVGDAAAVDIAEAAKEARAPAQRLGAKGGWGWRTCSSAQLKVDIEGK